MRIIFGSAFSKLRFGIVLCVVVIALTGSDSYAQHQSKQDYIEVPFEIGLDRINEKTGSRSLILHVNERFFDLGGLRILFGQIKKSFAATSLEVQVYADRAAFDSAIDFQKTVSPLDLILASRNTDKETQLNRKLAKTVGTLRAVYVRYGFESNLEQYIDYTPERGSDLFQRINLSSPKN